MLVDRTRWVASYGPYAGELWPTRTRSKDAPATLTDSIAGQVNVVEGIRPTGKLSGDSTIETGKSVHLDKSQYTKRQVRGWDGSQLL